MFYEGYHIWGMHVFWWVIWLTFLFWIFALPYDIPGQRSGKKSPLEILQSRFASGEISAEKYKEMKKVLDTDKAA